MTTTPRNISHALVLKLNEIDTKHPEYIRRNEYGFLRLYKVQPNDGGDRLLQIGSWAGHDGNQRADELERRDRSGEHRHPYDRS